MIGEEWDVTKPDKPVLLWDPNANIVIPIGLTAWLAQLGVSYGSHQIITAAPLECASQGLYSAGLIGVRMKLVAVPVYRSNAKYPFTVRVTGSDGITMDDRTLWLRIKER